MEKTKAYWWCPECKQELDGCQVTYQEKCESCGTTVVWRPEVVSPERMEEICQAEAEGRLVVLPCKVDNRKLEQILKLCSNDG